MSRRAIRSRALIDSRLEGEIGPAAQKRTSAQISFGRVTGFGLGGAGGGEGERDNIAVDQVVVRGERREAATSQAASSEPARPRLLDGKPKEPI